MTERERVFSKFKKTTNQWKIMSSEIQSLRERKPESYVVSWSFSDKGHLSVLLMRVSEGETEVLQEWSQPEGRVLLPPAGYDNQIRTTERQQVLGEVVQKLKDWTRFSCGHTNQQHLLPESDCPGWSIENDRARGVLLEQIITNLSKTA